MMGRMVRWRWINREEERSGGEGEEGGEGDCAVRIIIDDSGV